MAGTVFFSRRDVAGRLHRAGVPRGLMGRQWMELQAWTAPRVTHLTYAVRKP